MRTLLATTFAALALLASGPAAAVGLFESNHPLVEQGNEAFARGDYEGALRAYEAAEAELPRSAELHYNRGNALMKLGRADDARKAYERALTGAGDSLKARDYYNLGNAFSALGKEKEAISAWRQSLKVDPSFEPARHNLELTLLRRQKPQNQRSNDEPGDGGTPDAGQDAGQPDAGQDGGTDGGTDGGEDGGADGGSDAGHGGEDGGEDGGSPDAGVGDGGSDGGEDQQGSGAADGGEQQDGGQQADGGEARDGGEQESQSEQQQQEQPDAGSAGDGGTPDAGSSGSMAEQQEQEPPKDVDRKRAEQLLDAIRRNEKQFLMHQQQQKKGKIRVPERDW